MRALSLILALVLWANPILAEDKKPAAVPPVLQRKSHWVATVMAPNRKMVLEVVEPKDPSFTTFLFLPGIAGKLPLENPALIELANLGYGVATMNFSTQLLSVYALDAGVVPHFLETTFTMKDFALEVETVAVSMRQTYKIQNIIPVSLSFSGGVTPHLMAFPYVIETAPLTSSVSANPQGESYRSMLNLNFFLSEQMKRKMIDDSYRSVWAGTVDDVLKNLSIPKDRREEYIAGFTEMSRAAEGFDWKKVAVPKEVERLFLIAGKEGSAMKRDQLETAARLKKDGYNIMVQEFEGAGHIIINDKGPEFVEALVKVAKDIDCKIALKPNP